MYAVSDLAFCNITVAMSLEQIYQANWCQAQYKLKLKEQTSFHRTFSNAKQSHDEQKLASKLS